MELFPFNLSLKSDLPKLKFVVNLSMHYLDFLQHTRTPIVQFVEGGKCCVPYSTDEYIVLSIFLCLKPEHESQPVKSFCTFVCLVKRTLGRFRHLHAVSHICGPWLYRDQVPPSIEILDLSDKAVVDYDYVFFRLHSLLFDNFSTISTGWNDNDREMQDCGKFNSLMSSLINNLRLHRTIRNVLRKHLLVYKLKQHRKRKTIKQFWKHWMEHWMDPDTTNGFVQYITKRHT
jgi:hypothetical protein